MPYGMITGQVQLRDPSTGLLVYDADGTPQTDGKYYVIGNGVADFTGGVTNSISWKNFNLNFLIDFKSGGDIYSGTNVRMTQTGFTKQTLMGREGEAPLTVTGVIQSGTGPMVIRSMKNLPKPLHPAKQIITGCNLAKEHPTDLYTMRRSSSSDKSHWDTQFLVKCSKKTPLQSVMISFAARNLAILHKNVDNIDPESNYSSSNSQGLDYFGMPSTRSYGFNLRVTF